MQHLHPDVSIRWEWGVGALFLVREPSIGPFIPRPDCPSRLIPRIGIGKSASHSIHAAGIEEKRGGRAKLELRVKDVGEIGVASDSKWAFRSIFVDAH